MREIWKVTGATIALGCLCAGIWHGMYGEYPAACYWLLLSIINRPTPETTP